MKISIITVCYNSEKTIEDTIRSVLSQTYQNYEYLIIDGASKDSTLEIIGKYMDDPRIRLVSEKDKGIYDAMNKGISLASGDVIATINSDDVLYDENVFQTVVDHFDDETDIIYANVLYCDEKLEKTIRNYLSGEKNSVAWCPAHPSMYVRREVFKKLGNYDISFRICADYDFMVRCNTNDVRYRYVDQYFVKMRYGGASNGLKGYLKNFRECLEVLKKNGISFPLMHTVYRSLHTILQLIVK